MSLEMTISSVYERKPEIGARRELKKVHEPRKALVPWRSVNPDLSEAVLYHFRSTLPNAEGILEKSPYASVAVYLASEEAVYVAVAIRREGDRFSYKIARDIVLGRLRRMVSLAQLGHSAGIRLVPRTEALLVIKALASSYPYTKHDLSRAKRRLMSLSSNTG